MGQCKRIYTELQEQGIDIDNLQETEIDFDKRNYTDGAWWSEQDAMLMHKEREQLERDAEIQDYRLEGYGL